MNIVIFDTEYTSWEGCQKLGWRGNQKKEVVQISAVKINSQLDIIDSFCIYIRPKINPILSDYFENLTGITNNLIKEEGVDFETAYNKFTLFVGECVCWSHGWGSPLESKSDGEIIDDNLKLLNLSPNKIRYRNIAAFFAEMYKKYNIDIKSQASGTIASLLGRENNLKNLGISQHNAMYDVLSIVEGIRYFASESKKLFEIG